MNENITNRCVSVFAVTMAGRGMPLTPYLTAGFANFFDKLSQSYSNQTPSRLVIPIDTGLGKTTASLIFINQIVRNRRYDSRGIIFACNQLLELRKAYNELVLHGVATTDVGLVFTSTHPCMDGLQSCKDPASVPILLATHQMLKRRGRHDAYLQFNGQSRLVLWDEEFIPARGDYVDIRSLQDAHKVAYHDKVEDLLDRYFKNESIDDVCSLARPQSLSPVAWSRVHHALENGYLKHYDAGGKPAGLYSFSTDIPDELASVVILDASAPISPFIARRDDIQIADLNLRKSYEQVSIHCVQSRCGAGIIAGAVESGHLEQEFSEFLGHIEKQLLKDVPTLVICRKDETEATQRAMKHELLGLGFKDEILKFITWGQHASSNDYSECSQAILWGLQYRNQDELLASLCAQDRNHSLHVPEVGEAQAKLLAGMSYQGISRGACRLWSDGRALPMKVVTTIPKHNSEAFLSALKLLMPGVNLILEAAGGLSNQRKAAYIIYNYLTTYEGTRITRKELNAVVKEQIPGIAAKTLTRAHGMVKHHFWERDGKAHAYMRT